MNTPLLVGNNLSLRVGDNCLIDDISLSLTAGTFTAIIGPNGAGKTTLLTLIDGDVNPDSGRVLLAGKPLSDIDRLTLAQRRAVLPQLGTVPFAVKVHDIVALGREPYRYGAHQRHNAEIIATCLAQTDVTHLAEQSYKTLSGGEQHRVQIARTLAQIYHQPDADLSGKILFLDEPTNHLDIRHQYVLMHLLTDLQQRGLTVIAVMNDLSLTLQFAEHIILLNSGRKVGDFTPDSLVDSNALSEVYQMDMRIKWDSEAARYVLTPRLSR